MRYLYCPASPLERTLQRHSTVVERAGGRKYRTDAAALRVAFNLGDAPLFCSVNREADRISRRKKEGCREIRAGARAQNRRIAAALVLRVGINAGANRCFVKAPSIGRLTCFSAADHRRIRAESKIWPQSGRKMRRKPDCRSEGTAYGCTSEMRKETWARVQNQATAAKQTV